MLEARNLQISHVEKGAIRRAIVKGVSITVKPGQIVCLVGESGSGKSLTGYSLLNLMPSGNLKITGGEVLFNNTNVLTMQYDDLRKLRGAGIFMIPQDPLTALNPVLTIEEQIAEMFVYHTDMKNAEIKERCRELLELVKIDNVKARLRAYPHQLSGGQRQRVLIAMAMALKPALIIADEPTTALDVSLQRDILELFVKLKREWDVSFLLITHDFGVVRSVADYIYVMYGGHILEEGSPDEVLKNPLHPYTRGLIMSVPRIDSVPQTRLPAMSRSSAESSYPCPFFERCDIRTDTCAQEIPYIFIKPDHGVLCQKVKQ